MINGLIAGRYRIERPIGEGGMSRVFRAIDQRLDRAVAVKVLRDELAGDPEVAASFDREARTAASLSHPSIIAIYDVGQQAGQSFIVMELVDGQPLRQYIDSDAPFEPRDVLTILDQLCDALDYAHAQGVVHRDLKPENILITEQGRVKIGDFGIARNIDAATLTAAGTVMGSAYYISPEQAQGQPATPRSDIYAAGVIAYEMVTGLRPFSGDSALAVAMQHVEADPATPSRLNPRLSERVDAAVLKAMAKHPYLRFGTAMELADAVAAAFQPAPASPVAPVAPPAPPAVDPLAATVAMPTVRSFAAGGLSLPMAAAGPTLMRTGSLARSRGGGAYTGLIVGVLGLLAVLLAFVVGAQVLRSLPSLPNIAPPSVPVRPDSPNRGPSAGGVAGPFSTSTATVTPTFTMTPTGSTTPEDQGTGTPTETETPSGSTTPTVTETPMDTPTAPPTWTPTPRATTPPPTATPPPGSVIVPSVVGMTEQQAQDTIKSSGLASTFPNYQQQYNSQPVGHVLSQQPAAGTVAAKGTTVYIAVRR